MRRNEKLSTDSAIFCHVLYTRMIAGLVRVLRVAAAPAESGGAELGSAAKKVNRKSCIHHSTGHILGFED